MRIRLNYYTVAVTMHVRVSLIYYNMLLYKLHLRLAKDDASTAPH